jgi:hypothetical protein
VCRTLDETSVFSNGLNGRDGIPKILEDFLLNLVTAAVLFLRVFNRLP